MPSGSSERRDNIQRLLQEIRSAAAGPACLMEICGTHTMAIGKAGIRQLLPPDIRLLSGPGCPVCVTPPGMIDRILRLSEEENILIAAYGDMIRVPGSRRGDTLARRHAGGARTTVIYSPMDALQLAAEHPELEIVFTGIGFETSAPGTAAAIRMAAEKEIHNFSVLSMLKTVEPVLRALLSEPDFPVQGFLCPGHVAVVTGADSFRFLCQEYGLPAVISGFEPEDILVSVWRLLRQIREGTAFLENEYARAVSDAGNRLALEMISEVFRPRDDNWRGMGRIEGSGLTLRDSFSEWDAEIKFDQLLRGTDPDASEPPGCLCGQILQGRRTPADCPLFGTICVPEDPVGPCMVSGEGTCAAAFRYG